MMDDHDNNDFDNGDHDNSDFDNDDHDDDDFDNDDHDAGGPPANLKFYHLLAKKA